ncbi:MAG: AI-2E family transporter [Xanthomonadales bacterium]|nr:AI-2E family transporter [Xanthomonadales bacterium]
MSPLHQRQYVLLASYIIAALTLLLVFPLHLLVGLLVGLLMFEVIDSLTPLLQRLVSGRRARLLAVTLLALLIISLITLLTIAAVLFFRSEPSTPAQLFRRLTPIVHEARQHLPPWLLEHLPDSTSEIRLATMEWLRGHSGQLQIAGKSTVRVTAHVLMGLVLGALVALQRERAEGSAAPLPLAKALSERCTHLSDAFHHIVFAQFKIALLNTAFSAAFLLLALPLFGIHLPLAKPLVLITFIAGLLPLIGNLVSNTLVVVVALSVSIWVALTALIFLVLVHKLEYFLNARIIGSQIRAHAWELLLAMLVMEAAFGLPGVVAAPVFYAYLKSELEAAKLV